MSILANTNILMYSIRVKQSTLLFSMGFDLDSFPWMASFFVSTF